MECHSLQIDQEGITEVDDDEWFAGATISDLEKRNRDVDEKRIDNNAFRAKEFVNDSGIG